MEFRAAERKNGKEPRAKSLCGNLVEIIRFCLRFSKPSLQLQSGKRGQVAGIPLPLVVYWNHQLRGKFESNLWDSATYGQNLQPARLTAFRLRVSSTAFALAIICFFVFEHKVRCHNWAVDILGGKIKGACHGGHRGTQGESSSPPVSFNNDAALWQSDRLLEFQHYDFGVGAQAQGRAPGAGAAGSEDLHFADAAEAIDKLAVDATGHPTPGDELAEVRVSGKL